MLLVFPTIKYYLVFSLVLLPSTGFSGPVRQFLMTIFAVLLQMIRASSMRSYGFVENVSDATPKVNVGNSDVKKMKISMR